MRQIVDDRHGPSPLPEQVPEHTFDSCYPERKPGTDTPQPVAPASVSRTGRTVNVAGEYSKGCLFMKLCIACAYPSTPVLSGVWRTCGSIRGVATSALISVIQHNVFCVDNNLLGVSGQVTESGVLAFGQIFGSVTRGNEAAPGHAGNSSPDPTAGSGIHSGSQRTTNSGGNPVMATAGVQQILPV